MTVRNWGTADAANIAVNLYEGPEIDTSKAPLASWTVPFLAVDGETMVSAALDHIPYHLFAVVDPDDVTPEIDKSNNVGFESLPVAHGAAVTVVGSTDPNLGDILYTASEFNADTGHVNAQIEALLFDAEQLGDTSQLCDISAVSGTTDLQGKVVLVEKGSCGYNQQVNNAAALGAVAVLVYNDDTGGNLREVMAGEAVLIPAGFLPRQDGFDILPYHGQAIHILPESEAVTILDPYP